MAELYFKVKSDWEEVVKLRTEVMRLENQLNQFNGKAPLEVLDKMCSELTNAKTRLTELVEAAAVEGAKLDGAFKKSITIDVSTPMGQLKAFDDELQKMSSNLNAYFDTLKGKLVDMVSVLGDGKTIADNIKVNEENLAKIDELNRLNAELREQIKQIQQELDRQQAAWQQVQNTISGNKQAIDGLTQSQHQQAQASAESVARMNAAIDEETRKNEAAKKSWEDKKAEIESLQAELQKYQAAYDRVMQLKPEDGRLKRWWRETQFASAANNGEVDNATIQHVVGLNSKIEELKQRIKDAQKEEKALSDQFASSSRRVDELRDSVDSTLSPLRQMQQAEDAASKALRLNSARAMLRGITQEMDEAIDKMRTLEGDAERYRDYISKLENGDTSVLNNGQDAATELANARAELEKCEAELEKQKKEYNDLDKYQEQYKQQIVDASGHQMRMRTQIMQTREEMMKMIAEGKAGTPEFQQLSEKAGEMRKQMALANATMEYFANPSRHLEGLKSALQGVAGSASLVTGIMGVFNTNSEKMAAIQTKIQSYLGIIVGLETAYATVKKTSNAMLLISEVQTLALAKAKTYETIATEAGTIATMKAAAAQAFFNTVAKMNPYLLLVSGIGLLCGAIWGLTKVLKSESEEEKRLQKEREARIKEAREAHERWANDVASSAGKQIASYENLRRKWKELGNDLTAKKKFIDDNKDAFHDLGWAVNNVADAENLFTKNTQAVINAMLARAKAAAYQTAIADEYTKSIKKRDQIDNTVAGGGYRKVYKEGDRLTNDQIKALNQQYGINLSATSLNPKTKIKGVSFSTDSKLTAASAAYLTSLEAKDATKRWKDNVEALNKETEERVGYLTKGLEQAVKMQEQAVKAVGVQEWQGGNAGSGNRTKGNSPDEILKRQIEQEQEAERTRIQNQLLQQQAVIDQMDDGAEKELAQMRLNHKKRMAELDNEEREVLNKKIEAASNDKKGNPIKGFYTSGQYRNVQLTDEDMLGVNSKRISESESYADGLVALFKKIGSSSESTADRMNQLGTAYRNFIDDIGNLKEQGISDDELQRVLENVKTQFTKTLDGIHKEEQDAMRDYLKEYGTYEERRKAITEEYEEKIGNAKTDGERLILQKKQEEELDALEARYGKTKQFMIDLFGDVSKKSVAEIGKIIKKYEELEKFLSGDKTVSRKRLISLGFTDEEIDKALEKLNQGKITVKEFTDALKNMKGELAERSPWQKFKKEINDAVDMLKKSKGDSDKIGAAIENIGEACTAYLPQVEKFASGLYSIFGIDDSAAKNAITAINGLSTATTGIGQIISGNYLDGITNTVDGLSQSFNGLADMINDIYSKRDMDDVYNNIELEAIRKSVDKIVEKMDSSTIAEAIDEYENAMERYNEGLLKAQQNVQDAFSESSSSLAGRYNHRSINYYMNDIGSKDDIDKINKLLGTNLDSFGDLWFLSPDQLAEIEEKLPYVFSIIEKGIETMSENASASSDDEWAREALAAYMEFVGKKKEIEDAFNQKMTGTTYDTVKNEFKNILLDMTSDAEKFSEKFEDMLVNAIVNSMMSDKYNEELKEWYQAFSDAFSNNNSIDDDEARQLRDRYNDIVNSAIAERNNLFETLNINTDDITKQEADKKGFAAMSQDTGEELNGRFTALQIAGENISEQTNAIVPVLTDIGVTTSRTAEMVEGIGRVADDMLTNIVECYSELNMIRITTDEMLPIMKENKKTLEKIEKNTKNI